MNDYPIGVLHQSDSTMKCSKPNNSSIGSGRNAVTLFLITILFWCAAGVRAADLAAGGVEATIDASGRLSLRETLSGVSGGPMACFALYDAKAKQWLEIPPATSVSRDNGQVTCRYEHLGSMTMEQSFQPRAEGILVRYRIHNNSDSQAWLQIRQLVPWLYGEQGQFWDGFAVRKHATAGLSCVDRIGAFPMSCGYTDRSGLAVGLQADQIFSWMESGLTRTVPLQMYQGVKLVVDARSEQTVEFVLYAFDGRYNFHNALQVYYDWFPNRFHAAEGVDSRLYTGTSVAYPFSPPRPPTENIRRVGGGWMWNYGPFKITGDWYGRPDRFAKYPQEAPDSLTKFQKQYIDSINALTYKQYFERRYNEQFRNAEVCDVAPMFYIISYCDHRLAKDEYPDAIVTDPRVQNKIGPNWVHTGSTEYRMWWWNNSFARDTMKDLKRISQEMPISGFAIDCAGGSGGGTAHCRNSGVEGSPGRAWDQDGVYCDEAVAVAKMSDYIHSLKRDGRTMGVALNAGKAQWYMIFRGDTSLAEGVLTRGLVDMSDYELARCLAGQKPRCLYMVLSPHDTIGSEIEWKDMSPAQLRQIYRRLWNSGLLVCYRFAMYPYIDMVWGSERLMRNMPKLSRLLSAGWQPAAGFKVDKELWTARYGKGLNSYLFVGNQTIRSQSFSVAVDNDYLGDGAFVFSGLDGESVQNHIVNGRTQLKGQLAPTDPWLVQAMAQVRGSREFTARASGSDDLNVGSITLHLRGAVGKNTIGLRLPPRTNCRSVQVNGKPVAFKTEPGQVVIEADLPAQTDIELKWRSQIFASPREQLLQFPFTDGRQATSSIVLPDADDKWDRYTAERLSNYFQTYFEQVKDIKNVTIPAKSRSKTSMDQGNLIVLEAAPHPTVALDDGGRLLRIAGPDAQTRFQLATDLMNELDRKYVFFGKIGMAHSYTGDEATRKMREKAGLDRGKILWDEDDDHYPDTHSPATKPISKAPLVPPGSSQTVVTSAPVAVDTSRLAEATTVDDHTLLLCTFDKSLEADFARGPSRAEGSAALTTGNRGFHGEALHIKDGMAMTSIGLPMTFKPVVYDLTDNLANRQGTLELRINMQQFPDTGKGAVRCLLAGLVKWRNGGAESHGQLILAVTAQKKELIFVEYHNSYKEYATLSAPVDWKVGQWHHLAIVWNGSSRQLRIDGKVVQSIQTHFTDPQFVPGAQELSLGSTLKQQGKPDYEALMDDVRISDIERPLIDPSK